MRQGQFTIYMSKFDANTLRKHKRTMRDVNVHTTAKLPPL